MKKPWQIWGAFCLGLAIALTGLGWLTLRAIDLDRAERLARGEAEEARHQTQLQERIATALWRMDWMLAPLIAQEATRPSFFYEPFVAPRSATGTTGKHVGVASPLLTQPPPYVVLNFDVTANDHWTSPQSPRQEDIPQAVAAGVSRSAINQSVARLTELRENISYRQLLNVLPKSLLPATDFTTQQDGIITDNYGGMAVLNGLAQQDRAPNSAGQQSRKMEQSFEQQATTAPPPPQPYRPKALNSSSQRIPPRASYRVRSHRTGLPRTSWSRVATSRSGGDAIAACKVWRANKCSRIPPCSPSHLPIARVSAGRSGSARN